jgi:hypothetical protein
MLLSILSAKYVTLNLIIFQTSVLLSLPYAIYDYYYHLPIYHYALLLTTHSMSCYLVILWLRHETDATFPSVQDYASLTVLWRMRIS